jgi:hypothetical protein
MSTRFRDALPQVRGTYMENAALKDLVWFRAAGPAEVLFRPADADDSARSSPTSPADCRSPLSAWAPIFSCATAAFPAW